MASNGSLKASQGFGLPLGKELALKIAAPVVVFAAILLMPAPHGLSLEGQRALAIMALAVVLWATEALPVALTGLIGVVLLMLLGAVPDEVTALHGFSRPVAYFLIGILGLGLAVHQSGLAERLAIYLIRGAGGSPRLLYLQMLFSFAALTFALPSAGTRGAIMVNVYEQVMAYWRVPKEHPLHRVVMMAMGVLNRLGSTALLAGGITPVVASELLGGFSWTRWFLLMSVPFYAILIVGGTILYFFYRAGFNLRNSVDGAGLTAGPVKPVEIRATIIILGTSLLWITDFAHGLHPSVPALIALAIILCPRIGVLSWSDFERGVGWSNFFVIAASLSMAHALVISGGAAWFSGTLVGSIASLPDQPWLLLLAIAVACAGVRLVLPNIAGYLALVIPVVMAAGQSLGLNPLVCGMVAVVVGDSVVYYPAGGAASMFILHRADIRAPEIFRFGLVMNLVAVGVLFALALPYWSLVGEPLTR
jgi:solute carrier family 13 (sodium-dependent dicarboxylate transporter), member 2/3/5